MLTMAYRINSDKYLVEEDTVLLASRFSELRQ